MKKYSKNSNILTPIENKILIYSDISCVPNMNGLVIVENDGLYEVNGVNKTILLSDKPTSVAGYTIGEIIPFIGNSIPNGFLECNGSQFSQSLYPELYSLLGTNVVPDFREIYPTGGYLNSVGTFSEDCIKTHQHTIGYSHNHECLYTSNSHFHSCTPTVDINCTCIVCSCTCGDPVALRYIRCFTGTCSDICQNTSDSNNPITPPFSCVTASSVSTYGTENFTAPDRYTVKYLIYAGV